MAEGGQYENQGYVDKVIQALGGSALIDGRV